MESGWIALYRANEVGWDILGMILALVGMVWLSQYGRECVSFSPRRRGKAMRRERRDYVRRQTIDALVDFIELQVWNGNFTRAEAKELYRDARKYWPVKDLFPAPELLKEDIKKRLNSGTHAPVDLPPKERKVSFKRTIKREVQPQTTEN